VYYVIEYSLSVDNIFVFVLIYGYFAVPAAYQHRVLFWSILGAPIMRGIMIGLGAALLERFGWISYLFGAFLVFTGIRMAFQKEEAPDPAANPLVKRFKRIVPVATRYEGGNVFVRHAEKLVVTPLFVVLLMSASRSWRHRCARRSDVHSGATPQSANL